MTAHHCHAHGCETPCEPARFCCPKHWYSLRDEMKRAIWREYRNGQELTKTPTTRYLAVQQRAVGEIAMYKPKRASGLATWSRAACVEIAVPYFLNSERWRALAIERGDGDPLAFCPPLFSRDVEAAMYRIITAGAVGTAR